MRAASTSKHSPGVPASVRTAPDGEGRPADADRAEDRANQEGKRRKWRERRFALRRAGDRRTGPVRPISPNDSSSVPIRKGDPTPPSAPSARGGGGRAWCISPCFFFPSREEGLRYKGAAPARGERERRRGRDGDAMGDSGEEVANKRRQLGADRDDARLGGALSFAGAPPSSLRPLLPALAAAPRPPPRLPPLAPPRPKNSYALRSSAATRASRAATRSSRSGCTTTLGDSE